MFLVKSISQKGRVKMSFKETLTRENYETIKSAVDGLATHPKASAQDLRHAGELEIVLAHHHIACAHNLFENAHEAEKNSPIGKVVNTDSLADKKELINTRTSCVPPSPPGRREEEDKCQDE